MDYRDQTNVPSMASEYGTSTLLTGAFSKSADAKGRQDATLCYRPLVPGQQGHNQQSHAQVVDKKPSAFELDVMKQSLNDVSTPRSDPSGSELPHYGGPKVELKAQTLVHRPHKAYHTYSKTSTSVNKQVQTKAPSKV